jgi:uncharacterized protein (TIGR02996 family)
MGDECFLRAIQATPADDAPRLVYADWLDEHGQTDRAAFIRLQVEAARLPQLDARRTALEAEARPLLVRHHDEWLGPLRELATNWHWERGFPEGLTVLHEVFLDRADQILDAAPVRSVFLRRVRLPLIGRLAAMPELRRLAGLSLWHDGLSERSAELLAASPHLGALGSLNLGANRIRDRGAAAIATSPHLGRLRELDLSDNQIGTTGALRLAAAAGLGSLEVLDLRDNPVGPEGERAVRDRFGDTVRVGPRTRGS